MRFSLAAVALALLLAPRAASAEAHAAPSAPDAVDARPPGARRSRQAVGGAAQDLRRGPGEGRSGDGVLRVARRAHRHEPPRDRRRDEGDRVAPRRPLDRRPRHARRRRHPRHRHPLGPARPATTPRSRSGASTGLRMGDEIAIVGSPLGLSGSLSSGIVSALRESGPPRGVRRAEGREGRLVGLAGDGGDLPRIERVAHSGPPGGGGGRRGAHQRRRGLNFGIPIEIPKSMLAAIGPRARRRSRSREGSASRRAWPATSGSRPPCSGSLTWRTRGRWRGRSAGRGERSGRRWGSGARRDRPSLALVASVAGLTRSSRRSRR